MLLTNVLVVAEMKCNLFSCASAYRNDGIQTHLNSARHLVLLSGAHVNFANTKKHYSIGVNVRSGDNAYVAASDPTDRADFACAATGDDAELLHERLGYFSIIYGAYQLGSGHQHDVQLLEDAPRPQLQVL